MGGGGRVILDLCGGTGAWSKPYKDNGYNVIDVTLPRYDVRTFPAPPPTKRIHGVLAAPPCTHLASSGARWFEEKGEEKLLEALSIVDACLRIVLVSKPFFWCLENPVGRLRKFLGKPVMYFHPYEYGDPWTKKTCLWGQFKIPKKSPVQPEKRSRIWLMPPSEDRSEKRSITPSGFAKAFFEANP